MVRPLGAVLGADGLDLLALAAQVQRVEQVQLVFLGTGVEADDVGRQLAVDVAVVR